MLEKKHNSLLESSLEKELEIFISKFLKISNRRVTDALKFYDSGLCMVYERSIINSEKSYGYTNEVFIAALILWGLNKASNKTLTSVNMERTSENTFRCNHTQKISDKLVSSKYRQFVEAFLWGVGDITNRLKFHTYLKKLLYLHKKNFIEYASYNINKYYRYTNY